MAARLLISIMAVLLLSAAAAGCGGSEPDPLPKTAFVKQGNAICVHATKEREAALVEAAKGSGNEANPEKLVDEVLLPPTRKMVEELDDLGVPKGDEKQVEAVLTGLEEGIETVEGDPKKALGSTAFEKANEAELAYGLSECGI